MILFTRDEDGHIKENADFEKYDSLDELKKAVIEYPEGYSEGDFYISDVKDGSFADCWIKARSLEHQESWEEEAGPLRILSPGQHPGGNCYWIEPRADIYIPVWTEVEEG